MSDEKIGNLALSNNLKEMTEKYTIYVTATLIHPPHSHVSNEVVLEFTIKNTWDIEDVFEMLQYHWAKLTKKHILPINKESYIEFSFEFRDKIQKIRLE
jgi:Ni,Fe-hydrogenase I large subunit